MATDYTNQTGIFDPSKFGWDVTIVGLGGIGSAAAWALTKLGVQGIVGIDFDEVVPHNVPNQLLYSQQHVDLSKVGATREFLANNRVDDDQTFDGRECKLTPDVITPLEGVIVSAVDSMSARRIIWDQVRHEDNLGNIPLLFDGRIGGRTATLLTIDPHDEQDVEFYEGLLFSDAEGVVEPCSMRATIGTPMILAGLLTDQLGSFSREEKPVRLIEVDLEDMGMTTIR